MTTFHFENIEQIEYERITEIHFTLGRFRYGVGVFQGNSPDEKDSFVTVYHEDETQCPLCHKQSTASNPSKRCQFLFQDLPLLVEELLETPSLRLHWVFREYEVNNKWEEN